MLSDTPRIFVGSSTFTVTGMTCAHCERADIAAAVAEAGYALVP